VASSTSWVPANSTSHHPTPSRGATREWRCRGVQSRQIDALGRPGRAGRHSLLMGMDMAISGSKNPYLYRKKFTKSTRSTPGKIPGVLRVTIHTGEELGWGKGWFSHWTPTVSSVRLDTRNGDAEPAQRYSALASHRSTSGLDSRAARGDRIAIQIKKGKASISPSEKHDAKLHLRIR
jgi:hypothetical protein